MKNLTNFDEFNKVNEGYSVKTLKIVKDSISEEDWRTIRKDLGLNINAVQSRTFTMYLPSDKPSFEDIVNTVDWFINHGYISVEK